MSMYDSLYGREGRGIGPNEPEKKGFARFCQMVGRDLGQLLGTNLLVCLLCLTAALGVSLGVTLLSLPLTIVLGAATGLLAGLAGLLLAECCLRSLQNDPSQWLPRAKQSIASRWKTACVTGALGTLLLGLLCFVSAFLFEAAAQQGYYPAQRSEYGVEVRSIPRPAAPEQPLSAQEQKKRSRANWWYYHWGIVAVAAVVAVSVVYAAHGLMTAVDPDYTVAVVTAESLPDEAVQNLQSALEQYADDANGDGTVLVQVNNYTWSANASLTDMNGQMAGATQMNTDLANGESKLWVLEDPEGFEQAYGALSENLGADWAGQLIDWSDQPVLSSLDLGSYNTAADGSQSVTVQSCFARCKIAVLDPADGLWHALSS